MGKIVILDENTSNKIAAGEVVERPASVVKELVENSIDAGAGSVTVEIKNGGISFIKVSDNGLGIDEDDAELAFERHATSKIRNANDLEAIATLGFRGEALASIAAVSTVELTSRVQKNTHGTYVKIQGGVSKEVKQIGCPVGTTFVVRDLFFNTPARFKFLKKDSTEAGYVSEVITRIALGNPQISFRFINSNATVIHTPGNNDLLSTIFCIYGKETAKEVCEINYQDNKVKISGYSGKPEIARSNRNQQSLFINGRYVKSKVVTSAVDEAYKTYLLKNKFPFLVMNIDLNPLLVDVNVHPTKMEVRFSDDQEMFRAVYHAVSNALMGMSLIKTVELGTKRDNPFKMTGESTSKIQYNQQKFNFDRPFVREVPRDLNIKPNFIQEEEDKLKPVDTKLNQPEKYENPLVTEHFIDIQIVGKHQTTDKPVEEKSIETPSLIPEPKFLAPEESIHPVQKGSLKEENETCEAIFNSSKIVGQAFSTYIILQHENELLLIDQHAAHERIMYEQFKKQYMSNQNLSQVLIAPVVIELTHQEVKRIEDFKEFLNKLGFIFEYFGNNSIILREVPYIDDNQTVKGIFLEVIDFITETGKNNYQLIEDDALYTIACKAAVKANKKLDELEIREILKGLSEIPNPFTCPHGRPTIIRLTKYELEKKFKRII